MPCDGPSKGKDAMAHGPKDKREGGGAGAGASRADVCVNRFFKKFDGYTLPSSRRVELPLGNYIFFGREGCGKYTMALNYIREYSENRLHSLRTLNLTFNKKTYVLPMSDVHFEVEMNLLGSSAKSLWVHIMQNVYDITVARRRKMSIVLCKNCHTITNEHMDIMQSYVKHSSDPSRKCEVYYVFLTEHLSFIPREISHVFVVVRVPIYARQLVASTGDEAASVSVGGNRICAEVLGPSHAEVCAEAGSASQLFKYRSIIDSTIERHIYRFRPEDLTSIRNAIYDIFIYHISPYDVVWSVFSRCCVRQSTSWGHGVFESLCFYIHEMFAQYNSNYRPILHIEKWVVHMTRLVMRSADDQPQNGLNVQCAGPLV